MWIANFYRPPIFDIFWNFKKSHGSLTRLFKERVGKGRAHDMKSRPVVEIKMFVYYIFEIPFPLVKSGKYSQKNKR